MDKTYKSSAELKREAKALYAGHWGKAIKLNIVPTLFSILAFILIGGLFMALTALFMTSDFVSSGSGSFPSNMSSGNSLTGNIGSFIVGLITLGISFTTLDWIRSKDADFNAFSGAFSVFSKRYFVGAVITELLAGFFTVLWTLLFIIPGLIKSFSYSQAPFIFKDLTDAHPEADINYLDCITKGRELMDGHKFRFFILKLSFLGWDILAGFTLGIGYIWLNPYKQAAYMGFYADLVD